MAPIVILFIIASLAFAYLLVQTVRVIRFEMADLALQPCLTTHFFTRRTPFLCIPLGIALLPLIFGAVSIATFQNDHTTRWMLFMDAVLAMSIGNNFKRDLKEQ